MTAKAKKPSRRYSREQGQENRSRHQFCERLDEVGWISSTVETDMGEDLLVRIYDAGASTGLSFYVQLKSTADSAALKRKRSAALAYPLEVKDLRHWEVSATLVVVVVWDVEKRAGWWRPIPEIIKELDATVKGWRKQKTVAVSVPLANGTDDEGLTRLRLKVADHDLPLVPKPDTYDLKLHFPNTTEGVASHEAFRRSLDDGDAVEFLVAKIEHPSWHRRIYGNFDGPARISIGRSESSIMVPVRVDMESSLGIASLPYVELRSKTWGKRKKLLSNELQRVPIELQVELCDDAMAVNLHAKRFGGGVGEALEAARFALVMAGASPQVRLTALAGKQSTIAFRLEGSTEEATIEKLQRWNAFVDKLAFIQRQLGSQSLHIPNDGVSRDEAAIVDRVFSIVSRGEEQGAIPLSLVVSPGTHPPGPREFSSGAARVSIATSEGESLRLFDTTFETGAIRIILRDPVAFFAECERQIQAAQFTGENRVHLEAVPVLYEYREWIPAGARWERLTQLASRQDGYVTLAQARWLGYSEDVFLALVPNGEIDRIAPDVFHLAHFPRSDHEDLITLWLQTDRQGVLSHDTALLLHELSDISPKRRHITVPPGWEPGDRKLDANVVLHHGHVDDDEKRWLGPVPYTAPLRTLRDCIASHLSPDLIEQAVADGLRLGMFTEDDVPPDLRRGAA